MDGETSLSVLLQGLKPKLNPDAYVFVCLADTHSIPSTDILCEFKEKEGITVILKKEKADALGLAYPFVASWITLTIHSALEAVGLTAAITKALTENNISCNMVAAFYHDHLFVPVNDTERAMRVLNELSL